MRRRSRTPPRTDRHGHARPPWGRAPRRCRDRGGCSRQRRVRIKMFNVGWISSSEAIWPQGEDPDRQIRFPVPCYVIDAGDERILIDTGLNPAGVGDPGGFYGRPEAFSQFKLELEHDISEQVDV